MLKDRDVSLSSKLKTRKGFAMAFGKAMVNYARQEGSSNLKTYLHALGCCNLRETEEGKKETRRHCKTRICVICGAIRVAKSIDAYLPVVLKWQPYLVNLVVLNIPDSSLNRSISQMLDVFRNIQRSIKRVESFRGIRKLGISYRVRRKRFDAQIHVVVDGRSQAIALCNGWKKRASSMGVTNQWIQEFNEEAFVDIFKYSMKVLLSDRDDKSRNPHLYPYAVDKMMEALRNRRTCQTFGFELPKHSEDEY